MLNNFKANKISRLGILLALIVILDYISRITPFFKTHNGGTLSFVPTIFVIAAIICTPLEGFIFGCIASVFTYFIGTMWFVNFFQYLFDYPLAIGGAIAGGSLAWKIWSKWKMPEIVKIAFLAIKITAIQFISYTIAIYLYLNDFNQINLEGLSQWDIFAAIINYNLIYMGPIMVGNIILSVLVIPRLKKFI